ncbi:unnamed protein product [Staurois parvus]|uniref:Uncharacterized protein n=1 Tax=Staurois parvus TaxID=386267 RepID=A0ABN9HFV4_9NEOB|nr:unnamed protein product [Staurois parvus]
MIAFTAFMGEKAISVKKEKKNLHHPPQVVQCHYGDTVLLGGPVQRSVFMVPCTLRECTQAVNVYKRPPAPALLPSGRLCTWA